MWLPERFVFECVVNADDVDYNKITVVHDHDTENVVHIGWQDPPSPNGVILLYELELTRADIANVWMFPIFIYL